MPAYLFAAAYLLCADPISEPIAPQPTQLADLAAVHVDAPTGFEAIASSPVPAGEGIGSHFGYRISPRTHQRTFHAGLDFLVPRGTPVYAVYEGVVEQIAHNVRGHQFSGYGNAVVVHHPQAGHWSFYAHLTDVVVQPGQVVHAGDLVGHVGNTTNGRFPGMPAHLHFEVRHARSDGASPFPGPYRTLNDDPQDWLASIGVRYEQPDDATCTRAQGEDPSGPLLVMREIHGVPSTWAMVGAPQRQQ